MSPTSLLLVVTVTLGVSCLALLAVVLHTLIRLDRDLEQVRHGQMQRMNRLATAAAAQRKDILGMQQEMLAQVEALIDLYSLIAPRASMPSMQGWASAPTTLRALLHTVLEHRPDTVVECGSGSSSVWLGYALQKLGRGRCVSLEHDERYVDASRRLVRLHGLEDVVEVRHAPLTPVNVGGREFSWYDPTVLADLRDVGVVFVDGPPGHVGELARMPALPVLAPHCAEDAVFILDDTSRPDESEIGKTWIREFGGRAVAGGTAGTGWQVVTL